MASEEKKDFNAMLNDSKDVPKFQTVTDQKALRKMAETECFCAAGRLRQGDEASPIWKSDHRRQDP